ncbi:hypothetical protein C9994_03030 [Marivirga lumbricoides]|uniref:HTH luxR-type domain-containing protein n=1 Tax=Marivirga lumbricoides TaxID=1046115 RepID=A0A2T4DUF8_9BACT|nr:hypothetical protein C9994_03030 [Marivirga lumbricoides]
MVKLKLVGFLVVLMQSLGFAQYKEMLHQNYSSKVENIAVLYQNTINKSVADSVFLVQYTTEMEQWAVANQDVELALEARLLKAYSYWHIYGHIYPNLVKNLIKVAEEAKEKQILHVEARAVKVIANHYWGQKNYESTFEWLLRSAKILDEIEPEQFPNMAEHLNFIGKCYFYFRDYKTALYFYKKSSKLDKSTFNAEAIFEAQNTLGLCYQALGQLSNAEGHFVAVITDSSSYASPIWQNIASGNLGYNFYLAGNYEKAIPLLKIDLQNALALKDYSLAAGSATPLADIYLKQQQLKASKQKIEEVKKYVHLSGQTDRLRKLYPVISKWYASNNQTDSSVLYLDSAMWATNDYNEKYSSLKLLRANQKVEARDRQIEIEKLKTESKIKLSERNFIILCIVVLLIGTMVVFWYRNKYLIKKQEFKELTLESTKKALAQAKNQLKNLTLKVREDSNLISELKKNEAAEENQQLISTLKSKSILTNEDWIEYQKLFNQVYPYFSTSVFTYYPYLSQAELRCVYLEKLQLSNTEMALVLGVSTNTMRVTKHRIRKKLGLESQEEMELLIKKLG